MNYIKAPKEYDGAVPSCSGSLLFWLAGKL